jgi:hypothetical protein
LAIGTDPHRVAQLLDIKRVIWIEADLAREFGRILKSIQELLFQNLLPSGLSCEPVSPIVEVEALIGARLESCGELGIVPLDGVPVLRASSEPGISNQRGVESFLYRVIAVLVD